jgi:predicted nucleic acid-binding protein
VNVVDSSAWLSYFAGDGNADNFAVSIEAIGQLLVPTITITEVFKIILRQRGEEAAFEAIAHMEQGLVVNLDSELAINAARFRYKLKLPLADSIIYATAQKHKAIVWTQDDDFEGLDGVKYFPKL